MEDLNRIAREEAHENPNSIDEAVDATLVRLRELPTFDDMVNEMVRAGVRSVIEHFRHMANKAARRAAGCYGGRAKVRAGLAVNKVSLDYYGYYIGGRTLGKIMGEELDELGAAEAARAKGSLFNSALCTFLSPLVPEGKNVEECVTGEELGKIFTELQEDK